MHTPRTHSNCLHDSVYLNFKEHTTRPIPKVIVCETVHLKHVGTHHTPRTDSNRLRGTVHLKLEGTHQTPRTDSNFC